MPLVRSRYLTQNLYWLGSKTSCHKISWSLEAGRFGFRNFQWLLNSTGTSAATLPRCLSNFGAIQLLWHPIPWHRYFMGFGGKTSDCLVNTDPGAVGTMHYPLCQYQFTMSGCTDEFLNEEMTCVASPLKRCLILHELNGIYPDSKIHGNNGGPTWEQQDPGGSHVDPMNRSIWPPFYINHAEVSLQITMLNFICLLYVLIMLYFIYVYIVRPFFWLVVVWRQMCVFSTFAWLTPHVQRDYLYYFDYASGPKCMQTNLERSTRESYLLFHIQNISIYATWVVTANK